MQPVRGYGPYLHLPNDVDPEWWPPSRAESFSGLVHGRGSRAGSCVGADVERRGAREVGSWEADGHTEISGSNVLKLTQHMIDRLRSILADIRYGEVTIKVNETSPTVTFSIRVDERLPVDKSKE
jgi:hypothetical protein